MFVGTVVAVQDAAHVADQIAVGNLAVDDIEVATSDELSYMAHS